MAVPVLMGRPSDEGADLTVSGGRRLLTCSPAASGLSLQRRGQPQPGGGPAQVQAAEVKLKGSRKRLMGTLGPGMKAQSLPTAEHAGASTEKRAASAQRAARSLRGHGSARVLPPQPRPAPLDKTCSDGGSEAESQRPSQKSFVAVSPRPKSDQPGALGCTGPPLRALSPR